MKHSIDWYCPAYRLYFLENDGDSQDFEYAIALIKEITYFRNFLRRRFRVEVLGKDGRKITPTYLRHSCLEEIEVLYNTYRTLFHLESRMFDR